MTFLDLNWDVAELTRDMIDENWKEEREGRDPDLEPVERPDVITLKTENNDGRYRGRVQRGNDYIIVSEQGDRDMEPADIFWESQNYHLNAYTEITTSKGRNRLEGLYKEVGKIALDHRKRPATPGNWGNLTPSGQKYEDENFNLWVASFTFRYEKLMDLIG